jgi:cysteine desulfurase
LLTRSRVHHFGGPDFTSVSAGGKTRLAGAGFMRYPPRPLQMNASDLIYLDNNATTRVDPAVVEEMMPYLTEFYGNPSSGYRFGAQVGEALDRARERVAALLGCEPGEILFTSCGTESTNAALNSALLMDRDRQHIVTTRVEHSATLKHCETLARRGHEVTWLGVDSAGQVDLAELEKAIRSDTAIVSMMWANNETGVLFPIEEIAALVRAKGALFHTDAVQVIGKLPVRLAELPINFLSLSGHKLHCPKGVGALYVNRRTRFHPYLIGGGQEGGKRAGTQNVASIVALGKACELAGEFMEHEATEVRAMRDQFEAGVLARIEGVEVNGDREHRLPNTSNLAFADIDSEAVLMLLDQRGICCSSGSACTTGSIHASHVLKAMGFSDTRARSSLRFSFSRFNTADDVNRALDALQQVIGKLRALAVAA